MRIFGFAIIKTSRLTEVMTALVNANLENKRLKNKIHRRDAKRDSKGRFSK